MNDEIKNRLTRFLEQLGPQVAKRDAEVAVALDALTASLKPAEPGAVRPWTPARLVEAVRDHRQQLAIADGRWGRSELLVEALKWTGPARVTLATWTIGKAESDQLGRLLEDGKITELRLMIDPSYRAKCDGRLAAVKTLNARIAWVKCHAKFTAIDGEWGRFSETGSMNFNKATRLENIAASSSASQVRDLEAVWVTAWAAQGGEVTDEDARPRATLAAVMTPPMGRPAHVSDEEIIRAKIEGCSYREIAERVGRDVGVVFRRLNHERLRAVWVPLQDAARSEALEVRKANHAGLVTQELEIALGVSDATPQQVKALDNALSRLGDEKGQRLEIRGALPANLTVEQLTAIADGRATIDDHGQFRAVGG